jgi:hypothetical protein
MARSKPLGAVEELLRIPRGCDFRRPYTVAFLVPLRQTAAFISYVEPDMRKAHIVTTKRLFLAAILLCIVCGTALAQSSDPLVGTWKMNAQKSKGSKGGTTKIDAVGSGVKFRRGGRGARRDGEPLGLHRKL